MAAERRTGRETGRGRSSVRVVVVLFTRQLIVLVAAGKQGEAPVRTAVSRVVY